MPEVALRISSQLRTQHVLACCPEDVPRDGKWHKIDVKLQVPKQLTFLRTQARTGYYASTN